jgi:hypothetical protein
MKESYDKGLAGHIGPESCLDDPRGRNVPLYKRRLFGSFSGTSNVGKAIVYSLKRVLIGRCTSNHFA